jgi:hypothetical protein
VDPLEPLEPLETEPLETDPLEPLETGPLVTLGGGVFGAAPLPLRHAMPSASPVVAPIPEPIICPRSKLAILRSTVSRQGRLVSVSDDMPQSEDEIHIGATKLASTMPKNAPTIAATRRIRNVAIHASIA